MREPKKLSKAYRESMTRPSCAICLKCGEIFEDDVPPNHDSLLCPYRCGHIIIRGLTLEGAEKMLAQRKVRRASESSN